jgi:hypothetical protein
MTKTTTKKMVEAPGESAEGLAPEPVMVEVAPPWEKE